MPYLSRGVLWSYQAQMPGRNFSLIFIVIYLDVIVFSVPLCSMCSVKSVSCSGLIGRGHVHCVEPILVTTPSGGMGPPVPGLKSSDSKPHTLFHSSFQ